MFRASQHSSDIELVAAAQRNPLSDASSADPISLHERVASNHNASLRNRVPLPENTAEHEPPEAGKLRSIDVFGFIVNKMIGTGIYTNPAMVLVLTGNRTTAISFWVIGLIYTVVRYIIISPNQIQNV